MSVNRRLWRRDESVRRAKRDGGKNGPWTNHSRVLTFALGASAKLRPVVAAEPARRFPPPHNSPTPRPSRRASIFTATPASYCHGSGVISAGIVPDLRRSVAIGDKALFHQIVVDGILKSQGMVSFRSMLKDSDVEAIRGYLIDRAHKSQAVKKTP
ncbi:MAG: hypothetical protein WDM89_07140 [Rhizomicrobium sp.]